MDGLFADSERNYADSEDILGFDAKSFGKSPGKHGTFDKYVHDRHSPHVSDLNETEIKLVIEADDP